jgi:hypothetical protein
MAARAFFLRCSRGRFGGRLVSVSLSRVSQAVKISYGTFSKIADSVLRGIIALAWEAAQM